VGEVEGPARISRQPLPHLWVFVGCVVVDDCVDHFSRRDLRPDCIEEAEELLVPMAPHVAADSTRPTTFFTVAAASRFLPGLRVLSRASSSTPSAMNRACDLHTGGFDLPDRRMISAVDGAAPHVFLRRRRS
jgi:hypothetical protein